MPYHKLSLFIRAHNADAISARPHKITLPFELVRNTVDNIQHGELKVSIPPPIISEQLLMIYRFEYVRNFEQPDVLLPNTWIVVRIDGRGFHK
jgi:hypothetical protein